MEQVVLDVLRDLLEAERIRLLAEILEYENASQESLSDVSGENNYRDHMADQGSATFSRELDQSLEEQARETLAQIERALERMDAGTYGACTRCTTAIPAERLEAMPEAELCLTCKQREEIA